MDIYELRQYQLIQDGRDTVYMVSEFYPNEIDRKVVSLILRLPIPRRTTVRKFTAEQLIRMEPLKKSLEKRYDKAWNFKAGIKAHAKA